MAILDPQRFCPGVPVGARERDQVLIYRLKEDLRDLEITFPKREVEPVLIAAPVKGTPELELADKLEAYCALREARLRDEPVRIRNASAFLRSGLQQRLLSSVEAFWRTLIKHKRTIDEQLQQHGERRRVAETELDELALAAIGGGLDADETSSKTSNPSDPSTTEPIEDPATAEAERQTEKATLATLGNTDHPNFAQEMKLLAEMLETAEWARHQPDEKLKKLFQYIDQNMLDAAASGTSSGARWNGHRILIFTEYDDTLTYVRRQLEAHIQSSNESGAATWPSTRDRLRSKSARKSRRPSTPTPPSTRCESCWRPTRRARGSIFRNTASTCFTTTSPGTQPVWNSATVESTASFSPRRRSIAATSSTRTGKRIRSSGGSSRRPRTSIANSAASERSSTRTWSRRSAVAGSNALASATPFRCSIFATMKKTSSPPWPLPRFPATTTTRTTARLARPRHDGIRPREDRSKAPREA